MALTEDALSRYFPTSSNDIGGPASSSDLHLVNTVRLLFQRARAHRRSRVAQWVRNYEVIRNRTWGSGRPNWMPAPEVPEIYPILSAIVGWQTDTHPTFDVIPSMEPYSPFTDFYNSLADDLRTTMKATWQSEEYDSEVEATLWDAGVYGIGIFKSVWDQTLNGGMGNAILRRVDPFTFYPDPDAKNDRDGNYYIEVSTLSAQEVERRWPGSLKLIGTSGFQEDSDKAPTQISDISPGLPKANPGAISPSTSPQYGLPGQTNRLSVTDDPGITIIEAWLRVPCTIPYPDDSPDPITGTKPGDKGDDRPKETTYSSWRYVAVGGNHVLMDCAAEELWDHGQHPYTRYVPHETGEFYGISLVEMLAPSQISINRLLAAMEHNIWLIGNPVFMEDTRAGISRTKITNKPGQRIPKNSGGQADWLIPPQMHPQLSSDLVRFYIAEMERISGLSAMTRGSTPTGRNSQGVLDQIQEASFVRVRMSLRNLEGALRRAGTLIASLIVEFYDTPRMISMVGQSGERTSLALKSNHFYLPSENGATPMRFQLLIQAGSTLPTSRQARMTEADTLFALGGIDEEALLEAHDFPNRQIVLQRVREMKSAAGTLGQPPGARQRAH